MCRGAVCVLSAVRQHANRLCVPALVLFQHHQDGQHRLPPVDNGQRHHRRVSAAVAVCQGAVVGQHRPVHTLFRRFPVRCSTPEASSSSSYHRLHCLYLSLCSTKHLCGGLTRRLLLNVLLYTLKVCGCSCPVSCLFLPPPTFSVLYSFGS